MKRHDGKQILKTETELKPKLLKTGNKGMSNTNKSIRKFNVTNLSFQLEVAHFLEIILLDTA